MSQRLRRRRKTAERLGTGAELLQLFVVDGLWSLGLQAMFLWAMVSFTGIDGMALLIAADLAMVILSLCVLFWNGMIRVYLTSVQLGVKHRLLAAVTDLEEHTTRTVIRKNTACNPQGIFCCPQLGAAFFVYGQKTR